MAGWGEAWPRSQSDSVGVCVSDRVGVCVSDSVGVCVCVCVCWGGIIPSTPLFTLPKRTHNLPHAHQGSADSEVFKDR